jgi:hypothetical protein
MWVRDVRNSVVNQGNRDEGILPTDDDRRRFPGSLSELPGIGMAEGAVPTRGLDAGRGGIPGGEVWWVEALGVGWTNGRIEVSGGGSRVKRIEERQTRDPVCGRFFLRL